MPLHCSASSGRMGPLPLGRKAKSCSGLRCMLNMLDRCTAQLLVKLVLEMIRNGTERRPRVQAYRSSSA